MYFRDYNLFWSLDTHIYTSVNFRVFPANQIWEKQAKNKIKLSTFDSFDYLTMLDFEIL